ncbi:hypothetical protein OROGR_022950 [Orobanche gracilis]
MSPLTEKKKLKKDSRSKFEGTVANPVTIDDQPSADTADPTSQEAFRAEASSSPVPTATLASIPEQDPTHNRATSPVCDPHINRNSSPVRDPSPNRVPNPCQGSFSDTGEWKQEEEFILEITEVKEAQPLIQWDDEHCHMLIVSHVMSQDADRQEEKGKSAVPDQTASDEIIEESQPSKPATGHLGASSSQAPTPVIRPESQANARTEHLENLSRQTLFLSDAVDTLYQVGKEMDWLNLSAIEESASVQDELSKIKKAFGEFPGDMKSIVAELQKQQEKILLDEQSKLRISESKSVAALDYSNSKVADHDKKIEEMTLFINSLVERFAKLKKQQDNVVNVLQSIDLTVSELNVKKGEEAREESRESAPRRPSDRDSSRSHSSRHEHQHRRH